MPARILIIEDNAANLYLMIYLLGAFGFTTYAAQDGETGLEMASAERPDLIICDIQLPKLDGYGVVGRLKKDPVLRHIPAIAVTALAMVGDRERILQSGFDGYLSKPINPELLLRQVEPYLGGTPSAATTYSQAAASDPRPDQPGWTVLAVDNVRENLDLVSSLLEPFGYRVITASGGREGLEMAARNRPDLILSDVCMSDGTGYDFIALVKADTRLCRIPFVFITSSMMEDRDRERGLALGAVRFLLRPIDPEKLLAEISGCLSRQGNRG